MINEPDLSESEPDDIIDNNELEEIEISDEDNDENHRIDLKKKEKLKQDQNSSTKEKNQEVIIEGIHLDELKEYLREGKEEKELKTIKPIALKEEDIHEELQDKNEPIQYDEMLKETAHYLVDELYPDDQYNLYNKKKDQLEKRQLEWEKEYNRQLENIFNKQKSFDEMNKGISNYAFNEIKYIRVQEDKLQKETTDFSYHNTEAKKEIASIKQRLKEEKIKNKPVILEALYNSDSVDQIKRHLMNVDLTQIEPFYKKISMSKEENTDACLSLTGNGGDYLKLIGSVIYYISLVKKRYLSSKLENIQEEDNGIKDRVRPDVLAKIQSQIEVHFNGSSYVITFDSEHKKTSYTFRDLRNEICIKAKLDKSIFYQYYILEGTTVLSFDLIVYQAHLRNYYKHIFGEIEMIQMLDRITVLNNTKNSRFQEKNIKMKYHNERKAENSSIEKKKTAVFTSEITDYIYFYRAIEGIYLLFKSDLPLKEMKDNHLNAINEILLKENEDLANVMKNKHNENINNIRHIAREQINALNKKHYKEKQKYLNRKEEPIYISAYTIYKYHLLKLVYFMINIFFSFCLFYISSTISKNSYNELQRGHTFINNAFFANPLYKNFYNNPEKYDSNDINDIIQGKRDLIVWLNVIFNNLLFRSPLDETIEPEHYNNNLKSPFKSYEVFFGIRVSFKLSQSQDQNSLNDPKEHNFNSFPPDMTKDFLYWENELSSLSEDNQPKPIDSSLITLAPLIQFQEDICGQCFAKNYLYYQQAITKKIIGLKSVYEDGGYTIDLSNDKLERKDIDQLLMTIKEIMITNNNLRVLFIRMNFNHKITQTIIKRDVVFEISTSGEVSASIQKYIIDTTKNDSITYEVLYYFVEVLKYMFILLCLIKTFAIILSFKRLKFNLLNLCLDYIISGFIIASYILSLERNNSVKMFDQYKFDSLLSLNDINRIEGEFAKKLFDYIDLSDYINHKKATLQVNAIMIILIFLRNLLLLDTSFLMAFFFKVIKLALLESINLIFIIGLLFFCFGLIIHVSLGQINYQYKNIIFSLLTGVFSIFGKMDILEKKDLSLWHYLLLIIFVLLIKYYLLVFIYSIIYKAYCIAKRDYDEAKRNAEFMLAKEILFKMILEMLMPISWFFMIRNILKYRKIYLNHDFKKVVERTDCKL